MEEIDVLKAQVVRKDNRTPWGFRLQGGADSYKPLSVLRITPGSASAKVGLKVGDAITEIGDCPTASLTLQEAQALIDQHGETILLTLERKARGIIPANPVINETDPSPKTYQTFDMTGASPARHPRRDRSMVAPVFLNVQPYQPQTKPDSRPYQTCDLSGPSTYRPPKSNYTSPDMEVAQSGSFQPRAPRSLPPPTYEPPRQQPQVINAQSPTQSSTPPVPYYPGGYIPEEDKVGGPEQSRTFRVLQCLMEDQEPYVGAAGLPPPRSLSNEQMKEEWAKKHKGERVKVLMPQQYNSPMGMYSAPNVVHTFSQQAEGLFDQLERQQARDEAKLAGQQQVVSAQHK